MTAATGSPGRSEQPGSGPRTGGTPLRGLAKGLAVTLRTLGRRAHTAQYPDVVPALPPRSRGVIGLLEENCTVCMLCARECPDWCIYIDSHKESVQVEGAARARQRNVLDRFAIDFSLCMYCGICVEVCPFDALFWSPEFEYAEGEIADLTHERERLREWMWTVPPPPALDAGAPDPKEVASAAGPPAGRAGRARPDGGRAGGARAAGARAAGAGAEGARAGGARAGSARDEGARAGRPRPDAGGAGGEGPPDGEGPSDAGDDGGTGR